MRGFTVVSPIEASHFLLRSFWLCLCLVWFRCSRALDHLQSSLISQPAWSLLCSAHYLGWLAAGAVALLGDHVRVSTASLTLLLAWFHSHSSRLSTLQCGSLCSTRVSVLSYSMKVCLLSRSAAELVKLSTPTSRVRSFADCSADRLG